jgi:hypothetical protein
LFLDPSIRVPQLSIGWRLAKRALGMRTLMDVIPLDASLVKGSHGRPTGDPADGAVLISSDAGLLPAGSIAATEVKDLILRYVFDERQFPKSNGDEGQRSERSGSFMVS